MNEEPKQGVFAIATLGPDDNPNERIAVAILGQSETKDFYLCINKKQEILKVHIQKLKLFWVP